MPGKPSETLSASSAASLNTSCPHLPARWPSALSAPKFSSERHPSPIAGARRCLSTLRLYKNKKENPMAEKPPSFTVTDRRKFTLEGELREESPQTTDTAAEPPAAEPAKGPRLVTTPASPAQPEPAATLDTAALDGEEPLPEPTAEESDRQHAAYKESSRHLDNL